jgi:hypothetical protein
VLHQESGHCSGPGIAPGSTVCPDVCNTPESLC